MIVKELEFGKVVIIDDMVSVDGIYGNMRTISNTVKRKWGTRLSVKEIANRLSKLYDLCKDNAGTKENYNILMQHSDPIVIRLCGLCTKMKYKPISYINKLNIINLLGRSDVTPNCSLITHPDPNIRLIAAEHGDKSLLAPLLYDEVVSIRVALARRAISLDILIDDPDPLVRVAVAHQRYDLEKLYFDNSSCVKDAVKRNTTVMERFKIALADIFREFI